MQTLIVDEAHQRALAHAAVLAKRPTVADLGQLLYDCNKAYPLSTFENAEWAARVMLAFWPSWPVALGPATAPDTPPWSRHRTWTVEDMG